MKKAKNGHTEVSGCAATGNSPDLSGFIARLLAPLPKGEEPVMTPWFRRVLESDKSAGWRRKMEDVEEAKASHTYVTIQLRRTSRKDRSWQNLSRMHSSAYSRWIKRLAEQCLIPAPTDKELRWKERWSRIISEECLSEVERAIALDRQRLRGTEKSA